MFPLRTKVQVDLFAKDGKLSLVGAAELDHTDGVNGRLAVGVTGYELHLLRDHVRNQIHLNNYRATTLNSDTCF